jgi:hypothetical protein
VDADEYILHVTRANEIGNHEEFFYSDKEGVMITETNYTVQKESLPGVVHSWRVRAVKDGVLGRWSPIWSFTTEYSEETGPEPVELETEVNQNYPNPFNPSTQIRFTLDETQHVSLKVYDITGRLIVNLIDGAITQAGTHEVTFNADNLASGVYFYRFITESEIVTRKMTLMK